LLFRPRALRIHAKSVSVRQERIGAGAENRSTCRVENLNYTLPVVQAKSQGGLTAKFALNYNSQMWRKDLANNATWYYGRDNGYGHGWRLMAGSILPVHKAFYEVAFYVFTDSTGAEYRLDVNTGDVVLVHGRGIGRQRVRCRGTLSNPDPGQQRQSDWNQLPNRGEYGVTELQLTDYVDRGCHGILHIRVLGQSIDEHLGRRGRYLGIHVWDDNGEQPVGAEPEFSQCRAGDVPPVI
jgi:hypothetical protein